MKYILLTVPPTTAEDHKSINDYDVLRHQLEKKPLPEGPGKRLGQCAWLLPRDTAMDFVIDVAHMAEARGLKVEVAYLRDDDA